MNQKMAKKLRRMARTEMSTDKGVVDRELVEARVKGHYRVINNPNSARAMYLALKSAVRQVAHK